MGTPQNKMRNLGVVLALIAIALVPIARANDAAESTEIDPLVVKIHADWCQTCRKLEPLWQKLESELGDDVTLVALDVSDRAAVGRSQAEADRLRLSGFFREYRAATGTIAVIDGKTHEPVAIMRGEDDFSIYQEAIERARHRP